MDVATCAFRVRSTNSALIAFQQRPRGREWTTSEPKPDSEFRNGAGGYLEHPIWHTHVSHLSSAFACVAAAWRAPTNKHQPVCLMSGKISQAGVRWPLTLLQRHAVVYT